MLKHKTKSIEVIQTEKLHHNRSEENLPGSILEFSLNSCQLIELIEQI